jgi:hypothetical protein
MREAIIFKDWDLHKAFRSNLEKTTNAFRDMDFYPIRSYMYCYEIT